MKNYLLIGAGFSHNWGGWLASEAFEFLLGDSVVVNNKTIRDLLWKHQPDGGFEAALDELQRASNATVDEAGLRSAIRRMFDAMNLAFKSSANLEFGEWIGNTHPVRDLLVRFDAIFSINQDLLLEYLYRGTAEGLVDRSDPRTQRSWQLPGMQVSVPSEAEPLVYPPETGLMVPSNDQFISPDLQPIFKLHGSSNWRTAEGSEVFTLREIRSSDYRSLLHNYLIQDATIYLCNP